VSGLPGLKIVTPSEIDIEGTRIGSLAVTVALDPEDAQAHRGQANPIVFEVTTVTDGQARTAHEKSTCFVPR
jgi:hypothetical protein